MSSQFPWKDVNWRNSIFLIGTLVLTLTVVPAYLWVYGLSPFQAVLFVAMFIATGLSITLGYHRLFSHRSFRAAWPVRLFTLVFGAAAFENSVLNWAADHRRHHKFVDDDEDPYNIQKGFFHAHIGWILFKLQPQTSFEYVLDLQRDRLVMWQNRYYLAIAVGAGFVFPTLLGFAVGGWNGALASFLIAGVARTVFVQHMTFFINSLCHTIGRQPYSSSCSARDSGFMALFTFGEGYHNFHHEFQHDYRNGVKPWQFDPTKWTIWGLNQFGLATHLRTVPKEKILLAEIAEKQRRLGRHLAERPVPHPLPSLTLLEHAHLQLEQAAKAWEQKKAAYSTALEEKLKASHDKLAQLRKECELATAKLRGAMDRWRQAHQLVENELRYGLAAA